MRYYDAHNHLQDEWLQPHWREILPTLEHLPLASAVVNGTHPDDWERVAALARENSWVRASYGLHPWEVGRRPDDWEAQLEQQLATDPAAHVGEIGLDRWILDNAHPNDPRLAGKPRASLEEQVDVFRRQLALAAKHERVATIHCLQAWGPLLDVLRAGRIAGPGYLLHAYGGSAELVHVFAELGGYFSFNPSFLDPRKTRQREAFRRVPADRLLVETDAPAMPAPADRTRHVLPNDPVTGLRVGHPADLVVAYEGLAEIRGVTEEAVQVQVEENFLRLFGEGRSRF